MRSELQNALTAVRKMSLEQLPDLLGELETIRATALLRMTAHLCSNRTSSGG